MSDPLLELRDVCLEDGGRPIAEGWSLRLDMGESLAVVGPEGAGKSALLRMAMGLESPLRGEVRVEGRSLRDLAEPALRRLRSRMGYVPAERGLLANLTLLDNLLLPARYHERLNALEEERLLALFERLGLAPHLAQLPAELSAGIQRRALLARALALSPKLLLCNPLQLRSGDPPSEAAAAEIRRATAERGTAVILSVTSESELLGLADRRLRLQNARLVPA